jgi:hypothetical protein
MTGGAPFNYLVSVAVVAVPRVGIRLGRLVDNRGLGGEDHPRDRRGVEHLGPRELDRIDDTVGYQVAVGQRRRVQSAALRQFDDQRLQRWSRATSASVWRYPNGHQEGSCKTRQSSTPRWTPVPA